MRSHANVSTLISIAVHIALAYAAFKLWRWTRGLRNAPQTAWRRRLGIAFFVLPLVVWIAHALLPAALLTPLEGLLWLDRWLRGLQHELLAAIGQRLGALWRLALAPLVYALVYGAVGVAIGWCLDAWQYRKRARTAPALDDAAPATQARPATDRSP